MDVRDAHGENPLTNATYYSLTPIALRLLELGANVNITNISKMYSALHFAAESDQPEIMRALLQRGADYNAKMSCGRNIGQTAARYTSVKTMSMLADANLVDFDLTSRNHDTAVDHIAERRLPIEERVSLSESLDKLVACASNGHRSDGISTTTGQDENEGMENYCHLPGAYPVISNLAWV